MRPATRLSKITSQLTNRTNTQFLLSSASTSTEKIANMAAPKRPPITCHILDTTSGTPAPNVSVSLTLIRPISPTSSLINAENTLFLSTTNSDGRVEDWMTTTTSLEDIMSKQDEVLWKMTFDTGNYYVQKGIKPFFPRVEIQFITGGEGQESRNHYHVPLLVGPFSYTTYRGS